MPDAHPRRSRRAPRRLARLAWTATLGAAYLWPLEQPTAPTSTFGEYRARHFHGGVDLSTGETVGLPVRALDAGEVERVHVSGAGYGRALYLRLADGRTAVYGHLDGFAPEVARWVAAIQDSSGIYEQDLVPPAGRFRCARGDVVAWSGESGAGPAHLHLEVRAGDTGINPQVLGLESPDHVPPTLVALWVYPAAAEGRVEGACEPLRIALGGGAVRRVPRPVRVVGPVRLALEAFDRTEAKPNRLGVYAVTATLDGDTLYAARLDSVSWLETQEVEVVFDARARGENGEAAYALTPPAGLTCLALGRASAGWGRPPGPHALAVTARDVAGNVSRLEAVLEWRAPGAALERAKPLGRRFPPRALETDWADGRLTVRAPGGGEPVIQPPLAEVGVGDGVPWAERTFRVPPEFLGKLAVHAGGRARELAVTQLAPGWSRAARSLDGAFEVDFDSQAVFERTPVAVESRPASAGGRALPAVLPLAYRVEPEWLPLRRSVTARLRVPGGAPAGAGLFVRQGGGLRFVGGPEPGAPEILSGAARALGEFVVLRDTGAPVVRAARVRPAAARGLGGARPAPFEVTWRAADGGSGIDPERSTLAIDGRRVAVEYDPENALFRWRPLAPPAAGRLAYRLAVTDRLGNRAESAGTLRVP